MSHKTKATIMASRHPQFLRFRVQLGSTEIFGISNFEESF